MDVTGLALPVTDRSGVGSVRRAAVAAAGVLGLDDEASARAAIVATELATNVVKHGAGGWCFVSPGEYAGEPAVTLVASDRGQGIPDPGAALADGYSTAGSPGTGLGAIQRLSLAFDLHSRPGGGVVVAARVGRLPPVRSGARVVVGAVVRAKPGEDVSGDTWALRQSGEDFQLLVADGLGHGPQAGEAATAAAVAFRSARATTAALLVEEVHAALHGTRGAAIAVASVQPGTGRVRYAGIGNISGRLVAPGGAQGLVSMNGTAGLRARSIREFEYHAEPGALLVLHSDGLSARWNLDDYPGIHHRDPALVAALLLRDFGRERDDATAVAVRLPGLAPDGGWGP
jgi:anti-sigma regulatory factor (Ser/Thr protein kinase)